MAISIQSLLYLGFRLTPFILVSFFVISAIINSDIKGLIFLALLLLNAVVTIFVGYLLPETYKIQPPQLTNTSSVLGNTCNIFDSSLSTKLPLDINVVGFVFAYLLYIITSTGRIVNNVPTLIVFPGFIIYYFYWVYSSKCSPILNNVISLALGTILGTVFSYAIDHSKLNELQYFTGVKNKEVCSKPTKTKFRCNKKNAHP